MTASKTKKYVVAIEAVRCKECGYCIEVCNHDVLATGSEMNVHGYKYPVVVAQDKCIGCCTCMTTCPDFAIAISEQ